MHFLASDTRTAGRDTAWVVDPRENYNSGRGAMHTADSDTRTAGRDTAWLVDPRENYSVLFFIEHDTVNDLISKDDDIPVSDV